MCRVSADLPPSRVCCSYLVFLIGFPLMCAIRVAESNPSGCCGVPMCGEHCGPCHSSRAAGQAECSSCFDRPLTFSNGTSKYAWRVVTGSRQAARPNRRANNTPGFGCLESCTCFQRGPRIQKKTTKDGQRCSLQQSQHLTRQSFSLRATRFYWVTFYSHTPPPPPRAGF